jgi:exonuclease SbcD
MKVLFTSDWHTDAITAGVSRYVELHDYVGHVVDAIHEHQIDVVCFLGDAFDPGSMSEGVWSSFMIKALHRISDAARYGSVWIVGNHDVLDSSVPASTLSPLAVSVELNARTWEDAGKVVRVCEMPDFVTFDASSPSEHARAPRKSPDVGILALPYVARAVEQTGLYRRDLALAYDSASAFNGPVIVIGHYSIQGIHPGSEEEMVRGREFAFPAERISNLNPALVVNGHYHARQTVTVQGVQIEIVGAPTRFTFGEASDGERGFLIAEV